MLHIILWLSFGKTRLLQYMDDLDLIPNVTAAFCEFYCSRDYQRAVWARTLMLNLLVVLCARNIKTSYEWPWPRCKFYKATYVNSAVNMITWALFALWLILHMGIVLYERGFRKGLSLWPHFQGHRSTYSAEHMMVTNLLFCSFSGKLKKI